MKFRILHLHRVDLASPLLAFLDKHIRFLEEAKGNNEVIYLNAHYPVPKSVKGASFDAIILDPTFLGARWAASDYFERILDEFHFVARSPAIKIALPQDDYDCHLLLDDWMARWQVDLLYTVCPEHWQVLYPTYSQRGRIELAYTGYISTELAHHQFVPFESRPIDIGYRTKRLPPWFGRIGNNKSEIGDLLKPKAESAGFITDIAVGAEHTIFGDKWYRFMDTCKFTLGARSGSSLLDPYGNIQRAIREHLKENPEASFTEMESKFFPGQDGKYDFTALSPRNLEAALCNSCQILVKGNYSGILEPWRDYLPLAPDASNFPELVPIMRDSKRVTAIIKTCRDTVLNSAQLHYSNKAKKIHNDLADLGQQKGLNRKYAPTIAIKRVIENSHLRMQIYNLQKWSRFSFASRQLTRSIVGKMKHRLRKFF